MSVVAVEIALQVIAYVTWHRMQQATQGLGKCKVLCIGDSVTYGLGVPEEDSYPHLLGRLAEESGADGQVVNAGIPGQNSAEVLRRLPHLLRQHEPEHVILLVGWNDQWAKPERLAASALEGELSFPWKLRVGQLLSLAIAQGQLASPERRGDPAFLGLWNVAGHTLEFFPDGNAKLDEIRARWTLDGEVLRVTPPVGGAFDIRWRVAEHGIEFALAGWSKHVLAKPGEPEDDLAARMQDALARGDLVGGKQLVADATDEAERSRLLAKLLIETARMGQRDQAGELVAEVERGWTERRDVGCGEALALWLAGGERPEEGVALARTVLGIDSGRIECWRLLTAHASGPERMQLVAWLDRAARAQENTWRRRAGDAGRSRRAHRSTAALRTSVRNAAFAAGSRSTLLAAATIAGASAPRRTARFTASLVASEPIPKLLARTTSPAAAPGSVKASSTARSSRSSPMQRVLGSSSSATPAIGRSTRRACFAPRANWGAGSCRSRGTTGPRTVRAGTTCSSTRSTSRRRGTGSWLGPCSPNSPPTSGSAPFRGGPCGYRPEPPIERSCS